MNVISSDWSERHKELNKIIRKADFLPQAIEITLDLHSELHTSEVSGLKCKNAVDELLRDLQEREYAIMPTSKDETMAWAVWHIARIEDLTMNILVNNASQVFNESWKERMQVSVSDTGNAMTDEEIMQFSKQVCVRELLSYRSAVGSKSREIVWQLKPDDMKRKVSPESISRILKEGGVTEQENSRWLLDFWGKKDVAGILLMPLTRHQTCHLNDCYKWKEVIRRRNSFFAI
jgi:hypothetical protein